MINVRNPVSVICMNECWLSKKSDVCTVHLLNYNIAGQCPGHSHGGLITYVHDTFRSDEVHID